MTVKMRQVKWRILKMALDLLWATAKIFNWKPLTKRSQGRPKYRWEDNIKQDICQMTIKIGKLASRIERNGRRRSLRRTKLSAFKGSSAPGRRRRRRRRGN
jgi:hypothetical protein